MLTRSQRVYRWDRPGSSICSDRLERDCLPHLQRAIAVYRAKIGERRGRVREAARAALSGLRPDRVEALIKLLEDAASYDWPRGGEQGALRLKAFAAAAPYHPLLDRDAGLALLADVFGSRYESGDGSVALLYADYPEFHRLTAFPAEYSSAWLAADYDLAQAQALLYDATRVEVDAGGDFKHIVQYAHLSRLLYRIERLTGGRYRFVFDGPNSVLRLTHAYGVDFAKFLAALVQAKDWRMRAEIVLRKGWRPLAFALSGSDGYASRVPAPRLFDSSIEASFAKKFGPRRDGWRLDRETVLLHVGASVVVPDFVFTHDDGTEVALEIVGYWTPEYVAEKLAKLSAVRGTHLIVAIRPAWALKAASLEHNVLLYKKGILLRDLMPRLQAFRGQRP
jgi:predicted nuclease of restriction endonuclease-like RecB superfamily